VEHPLGGALPLARIVTDLDQFTGERKLLGIDTEVFAQTLP
jgi:hypothetical protein